MKLLLMKITKLRMMTMSRIPYHQVVVMIKILILLGFYSAILILTGRLPVGASALLVGVLVMVIGGALML